MCVCVCLSVFVCLYVCLSVCLCSVSRWTGAAAAAALCVGAADLASPRASAIDATLCAAAANPPPTANPPQAGAVQTAATNRRRNGPTTTTTTTTTRHTGQTGRELYLKDALRPRTLSHQYWGSDGHLTFLITNVASAQPNAPRCKIFGLNKASQDHDRNLHSDLESHKILWLD